MTHKATILIVTSIVVIFAIGLGVLSLMKRRSNSPSNSNIQSSQSNTTAVNKVVTPIKFTHQFFDPAVVSHITPLGELNGGYEEAQALSGVMINLKSEAVAHNKTIDIYAPTDLTLESYAYFKVPEEGNNQWTLIFRASDAVMIKVDHITDALESVIAATTTTPKDTSAEESPTKKLTFKAGELIARTRGTKVAHNWNIYVTDTTHTNTFMNQARFATGGAGDRLIHGVCPFDYYDDSLKSQFLALMGYSEAGQSATCGNVSRDKAGTAAGQWFLDQDSASGLQEKMDGNYASPLALFKNSAAEIILDQFGGKRLEVTATNTTFKDPEEITDTHCYAIISEGRSAGYVYVKLIGANQMSVAYATSGSCPSTFPASAKTYYR